MLSSALDELSLTGVAVESTYHKRSSPELQHTSMPTKKSASCRLFWVVIVLGSKHYSPGCPPTQGNLLALLCQLLGLQRWTTTPRALPSFMPNWQDLHLPSTHATSSVLTAVLWEVGVNYREIQRKMIFKIYITPTVFKICFLRQRRKMGQRDFTVKKNK